MANWLKHFDQTALGLLFTDQHLSPTEVVRIAREEQRTIEAQCCAANTKQKGESASLPRLVGLR